MKQIRATTQTQLCLIPWENPKNWLKYAQFGSVEALCPLRKQGKMRVLVVLTLALAAVSAIKSPDVDPRSIDWSVVRTLRETDKFRARFGLAPLSDDEIRQSRISGGTIASPTDIPWAVGVLIHGGTSGHSFCTGTLISARFVLTAANCVQGYVGFLAKVFNS